MAADKSKLYVVNMDFDGGALGEVIAVDPRLVEDWIDAGFVSEVDGSGNRIVQVGPRGKTGTDEGAAPVDVGAVRPVSKDDLNPE